MVDDAHHDEQLEAIELAPTRKVGAFEFMADHLFDLVVVVIREGETTDIIRRVELYYSENQRISCFAFDRASKAYQSDTHRALQAALAQLFKEAKSRTLSHQPFVTWYYTADDQRLMELHAGEYAEENKAVLKYFKILKETAQIIPEPEDDQPV